MTRTGGYGDQYIAWPRGYTSAPGGARFAGQCNGNIRLDYMKTSLWYHFVVAIYIFHPRLVVLLRVLDGPGVPMSAAEQEVKNAKDNDHAVYKDVPVHVSWRWIEAHGSHLTHAMHWILS